MTDSPNQENSPSPSDIEALQASVVRYRELAEMLPETIFEINADGRLTYVNTRAFHHFGYTREEFEAGILAVDIVAPQDRPRAIANISRLLQGEDDLGLTEYTVLRKDGSTFPALFHSTPILRDNHPVGLRGFVIDISSLRHTEEELHQARAELERRVQERTVEFQEANSRLMREVAERRAAESALQKSEERYRTLLANLDDIVYTVAVSGIITFVSDQVRRYGYEPEELIGRNFSEMVDPRDRDLALQDLKESLQQTEAEEVGKMLEFRLLSQKGEVFWAEERGRLLRDESGNLAGVTGIIRDITERHRREAELLATQQVRQAVWQMRTTDDFQQFLKTVKSSLEILEIPFSNCGVNVLEMERHPPKLSTHTIDLDSDVHNASLTKGAQLLLNAWRSDEILYRRDLHTEDRYNERRFMTEDFNAPIRSILDVPFSHGTVAVNSTEPEAFSEAHIASLQLLAEVLSEAFRRVEDLRHLENRNRKLTQGRREMERLITGLRASSQPTNPVSIDGTTQPPGTAPLSDEQTQQLILLDRLEGDLLDSWEDLFPTIELVDIALFGERLIQLGNRFAYSSLTNLGEKLLTQSSLGQVDELPQSLEEYLKIIDELKSLAGA
ncbi:MAG: PAS domain S-box protein [Gemmatimonadetes bacterium]|jgi:PAS domain S-box-containing protein|nr:PAS domain S-box protein [Gemmatimonadota bacterium]